MQSTGNETSSSIRGPSDAINTSELASHLEAQYNIRTAELIELDQGVFRVNRHDGPPWVARVFPPTRQLEVVKGDAEILRFLQDQQFPAERCVRPEAVSVKHDGFSVLVTEFVKGRPTHRGPQTFRRLGDLLGRLHTLSPGTGAAERRGGSWHHICNTGGPREEIDAALAMLIEAKHRVEDSQQQSYDAVETELKNADDFQDLPQAFLHPDFVPSNIITSPSGELIAVDWTGSGRGPRISSLGFLLWAAGHRGIAQVEAVVSGYAMHVRLEPAELTRLADAISHRPLILACWEFGTGRKNISYVADGRAAACTLAKSIAATARHAFENKA